MYYNEFLQASIFIIFSILAPVITFGGGIIVSNGLTFTGINLVQAAGITIMYFLVNGIIATVTFWKNIIWSEVKAILPISTIGSVLGALFLSKISPTILLIFMLYFALRFLYQHIFEKENIKYKTNENNLSKWSMALLSGFLSSAALPGGGLRNTYLLSKGYLLHQVHGTTSIIGIIGWALNIFILFQTDILKISNTYVILIVIPFLILSNYKIKKGLLHLPKSISHKISLVVILLFSLYAIVSLVLQLI